MLGETGPSQKDTARPRHMQDLVPSKSQDGGARAVGVRGGGGGGIVA